MKDKMKKGLAVYIGIDVPYMTDKQSYNGQAALEKDEEGSDGLGRAQMFRKSCFGKRGRSYTFLDKRSERIRFYLSAMRHSKATALGWGILGLKSAVSH